MTSFDRWIPIRVYAVVREIFARTQTCSNVSEDFGRPAAGQVQPLETIPRDQKRPLSADWAAARTTVSLIREPARRLHGGEQTRLTFLFARPRVFAMFDILLIDNLFWTRFVRFIAYNERYIAYVLVSCFAKNTLSSA